MKKYLLFTLLAAIFLISPETSFAAGDSLLQDVTGLITGSFGTVVGLGVSLFGLWVWLAQQSSWGILILIAGAAVTAFPSLHGGLESFVTGAFSNSSNSSTE